MYAQVLHQCRPITSQPLVLEQGHLRVHRREHVPQRGLEISILAARPHREDPAGTQVATHAPQSVGRVERRALVSERVVRGVVHVDQDQIVALGGGPQQPRVDVVQDHAEPRVRAELRGQRDQTALEPFDDLRHVLNDVDPRDARARERGLPLHAERGEVRLSDYWKDRTSVFIFLRHFG